MNQRERKFRNTLITFALAGLAVIYAVPALVNIHDSLALICALALGAGWLAWGVTIINSTQKGK